MSTGTVMCMCNLVDFPKSGCNQGCSIWLSEWQLNTSTVWTTDFGHLMVYNTVKDEITQETSFTVLRIYYNAGKHS